MGKDMPIMKMNYQNGEGTAYNNVIFVSLLGTGETGATNNASIRFGSDSGSTYLTAGECGADMPAILGTNTENIYMVADGGVEIYTGCANDGTSYTQTLSMTSSKITSHVQLYGAVWNDYAEYRQANTTEPGRVVYEVGDDTLSLTNERMTPACSIISDTFGFAIGETEKCKTPLAQAGRVLAYSLEDRNSYKPGDAVCSGPNGTVSKMTHEEKINHPECIIGYVSCVPTYDTWGEKDTKVNGRIWIKVV